MTQRLIVAASPTPTTVLLPSSPLLCLPPNVTVYHAYLFGVLLDLLCEIYLFLFCPKYRIWRKVVSQGKVT